MCYVAAHTSIYTLSLHDALPICHLALLHRFEQGGLRPGRGSIDLVDQDDVGEDGAGDEAERTGDLVEHADTREVGGEEDRKSTRLNSSHMSISYAVFCLKKKKRQ